jgi:FAD/FMN-containing dehydrogenase
VQPTVETSPQAEPKRARREDAGRLRSQLRGDLLTPQDPAYEQARGIWNAMIDKRPALIARCAGAADVQACVRYARETGLALAVRGGGHNIAGSCSCEGGLVIDLSDLREVRVDPEQRSAEVFPGALLADFDHEAQAYALATPLGINSTTGVAGLTLGGGFGWLSRKHGLTVDNFLSADVVSAEGALIHASERENEDLFWALRGGGGNFGVVTRFEFRLHPVGPEVYAGLVAYPISEAKRVLTAYRELVDRAPDELSVWIVMRAAPPLPFLPAAAHGHPMLALAICYAGDLSRGEQLATPYRQLGSVLGEHLGPAPYRLWQQTFDPLLGRGARNYWKSHMFDQLSDPVIDTVLGELARLPSPETEVFFGLLGGQASRVDAAATAYPHRSAKFAMNLHGRWQAPEQDAGCMDWARSLFRALSPHATGGVYVNFLTEDETERTSAAYGGNYARLATIKRRYDPDNLFRANQNIRPA